MNKYDSYKDSEVDWIGEIPNTWNVSSVKKYFVERKEKVSDLDFPPLSVTKKGILPQLDNVSKSDNHNDRKRVCINDFVINSRSDRKGSSGMSVLDGSVSLINIVLEPKSITPKYSEYLFKSKDFIEEFFRNGKGIHWDLWSTRFSELQNIKIPIPSILEQEKIVVQQIRVEKQKKFEQEKLVELQKIFEQQTLLEQQKQIELQKQFEQEKILEQQFEQQKLVEQQKQLELQKQFEQQKLVEQQKHFELQKQHEQDKIKELQKIVEQQKNMEQQKSTK